MTKSEQHGAAMDRQAFLNLMDHLLSDAWASYDNAKEVDPDSSDFWLGRATAYRSVITEVREFFSSEEQGR